jgi:hypothetical protein
MFDCPPRFDRAERAARSLNSLTDNLALIFVGATSVAAPTRELTEQSENVYENKGSLSGIEGCRAGADVGVERLRCAEGAVRSDCAAYRDLSLRDIADPRLRGLRQPGWLGWELNADCSFSTNDPGMSMKTNSRAVEKLRSREAERGRKAMGCRWFDPLRLSTLDFST